MNLPQPLETALLALAPSALDILPELLTAACRGKRQAAADALEELTRRQVFEAIQRAKRDGRGRKPEESPAKPEPRTRAPRRVRAPATLSRAEDTP